MADVKWIKLAVDLFDNRKIKQLEKLPDGDRIILIWIKILCLAGIVNDSGSIYFTRDIPYTEQTLATEFNRPLEIIQLALSVFQKFEMIEIVDDLIRVTNWASYQNVEGLERIREQGKVRSAKYRDKKAASRDVTRDVTVAPRDAIDTDIERESDTDNKEDSARQKAERFSPPALDDVVKYINEKGYEDVDPGKFLAYYSASDWHDKDGKPVKNWKQKIITWSGQNTNKKGKTVSGTDAEKDYSIIPSGYASL